MVGTKLGTVTRMAGKRLSCPAHSIKMTGTRQIAIGLILFFFIFEARAFLKLFSLLLQLRVFRLGFLQDGDVGVGIFPQRQKILISRKRTYPSLNTTYALCITRWQSVGTR